MNKQRKVLITITYNEMGVIIDTKTEKLGSSAQLGTDCISRQVANVAICNACGKIDCDKMDKCEKLQLPPANCSEFPNGSDTISRQDAVSRRRLLSDLKELITAWEKYPVMAEQIKGVEVAIEYVELIPSAQPDLSEYSDKLWRNAYERGKRDAQPERTDCEYCHEDSDGFVTPLEKNGHAFVRFGMNGWELSLKANGWHGSAKIRYCPMCGRDLLVK